MKKNYTAFVLLLCIALITACSKDGLMGPEGPAGAAGAAGPAGKDGSIMYSGTIAPTTATGALGDYYLNRATGQLYGPKVAAGWGTPIVLIGATGATGATGNAGSNGINGTNGTNGSNGTNGANGSTQLSGTGAPAAALGANGDYYLDKSSYLLYGPKTNSGWGTAILLRGADGAQGPTGPAGADGTIIYGGDYFPDPALGKVGDFFIGRYTVMLYGPKTAAGWPATGTSLRGANGAAGTNGTNGTNGVNGNTVLNGSGRPAVNLGTDGDFYIDLSTYQIYGPKTAGLWGTGTSLKGADGNANVVALETSDTDFFQWSFQSGTTDQFLRRYGSILPNDTTSTFNIPVANFAAAQHGLVLVYIRKNVAPGVSNWQQLNYTEAQSNVAYRYTLRLDAANASVRISYTPPVAAAAPYSPLTVDKVRIVIIPQSTTGILSVQNQLPLLQAMQKLDLKDTDFIRLK